MMKLVLVPRYDPSLMLLLFFSRAFPILAAGVPEPHNIGVASGFPEHPPWENTAWKEQCTSRALLESQLSR